MARRSLWYSIALLLALIFVTANGLRGPSSQVEGHETRTISRSRGGSRFNSKAIEGLETSTLPFSSSTSGFSSRARNGRRGASRSEDISKLANIETTTLKNVRLDRDRDIKVTAGNGRKSSNSPVTSVSSDRRRLSTNTRKSSTENPQRETTLAVTLTETPRDRNNDHENIPEIRNKEFNQEPRRIGLFRTRNGSSSRRVSTIAASTEQTTIPKIEDFDTDRKFDTTGPSVFSGTTEIPRSRTGRKIQTTLSSRDLKSGIPTSGRFITSRQKSASFGESSGPERRSDNFSTRKRGEIVPSGSESISVDIPLTGKIGTRSNIDNSPLSLSLGLENSLTSSGRERKTRGRLSDEGTSDITSGSRSTRRGSSRFAENGQIDNSLEKNARSRNETPRSRNSEAKTKKSEPNETRSRTRGRSPESTATKFPTSSGRSEISGRNSGVKANSERRGKQGGKSSMTENKKIEPEVRTRSRVNSRSTGTNPVPTTLVPEETTLALVTAESATVSTQVVSTSSTLTSTTRSPRVQERTESTTELRGSRNRGRTTATTSAERKVPKEDFFNHGLGFRGRKIVTEISPTTVNPSIIPRNVSTETPPRGNPGWTLKRRPGYYQDENGTTTSSPTAAPQSGPAIISNEILTSNEVPESTTTSMSDDSANARGLKKPPIAANGPEKSSRGSKTFPKNSSNTKVNGDPDEGENYPADFKAKLAQLKNVNTKEATARPGLGELSEKFTTRHTRSTSLSSESKLPDDEVDETTSELSLPLVFSTIPIFTKSLADLSTTETPNVWTSTSESGLFKKRPATDPQYVVRSRQKLESAAKLVLKPQSNNDDGIKKPEKRPEVNKRTLNVSTIVKTTEDRKSSKFAKRFGAPKTKSSGEKLLEVATIGGTERKSFGVKKIRKNDENIEATTLNEIDEENDLIERTTIPYSKDVQTIKKEDSPIIRSQTTKPWILSRKAKEVPRENVSTTRRSRAWNAPHIDKNFQEPVRIKDSDDSSTRRSAVSTTKKSRVWHAAHTDKNFQEPVRSKTSDDSSTRLPVVSTTIKSRVWHAGHRDKNFREPIRSKKPEDVTRRSLGTTTTTRKTRAWNVAYIDKNWQEPTVKSLPIEDSTTMKITNSPTTRATVDAEVTDLSVETSAKENVSTSSRYMRKKTETFKPFESVPKIGTTEQTPQTIRQREFRPRTATYRRHSEPPAVMIVNAVSAEKPSESNADSLSSIAITPKVPIRFQANLGESETSSTQRSARQEPTLNVEISTDNETVNTSNGASGIVEISNGNNGNTDSNIFNPTRSTFLLRNNATFLEQLRSTVAPLLGALGNRTPIFAGAYSNVNNSTSGSRVTPSGSPPRFSARYKGAELFVRRPNVLEPAGPFLTSSTTPFTPTQNSDSAPSISIESPGEPKVLTFYRALETASITNELEQTDVQQPQFGRVAQVEQAQNATDSDINDTTNANNETITTTIPTSPLPINETTVESITMDIGSVTTIETSQITDTTTLQENATPSPELTTILPETTVNFDSENDISNTEAIQTTEIPVGTTLKVTEPSTQSDTTTQMFSSSDLTTAMPAMTEMITDTIMTEEVTTQTDPSTQNDAAPAIFGRILYSDDTENLTMTTEIIGGSTTLTSITEFDSSSTTISNEITETSSTDRTTSEVEMVTIVPPSTEVPSTPIPTTMESSTLTVDEATPGMTSSMIENTLDDKSNLQVVVETGTSVPENMAATTMTDAVTTAESTAPETTTAAMMTDSVTIAESTTPEPTTAAMMTDSVTIAESTTAEPTTAAMMTDSVTIAESTTPEPTTAAMMTDTVTIAESTTPETTTAAMMTDSVTISESTTPETTTAAMMTDSVTIAESTTPETTTAAMMTDSVTISESTTPETTTAAMMTDSVTISESTAPETTELLSTAPISSESPAEMTTTMMTTSSNDEATTRGMLEIVAQLGDSTTTGQVTIEDEIGVTQIPMLITTSASAGTDITTNAGTLSEKTEAPNPSIVDMIEARLANNSDIASIFDDKLMSQMMMRIMSVLFTNSSEGKSSFASDTTPRDDNSTGQSIEQSNNTETMSPTSIDDVPQFLGGFLDNTDKNMTSDVLSLNNGTDTIENSSEMSDQSVETSSSPEVTSSQVTTTPTTPSSPSQLGETTLTPSGMITNVETSPDTREDLASTLATDVTNVTTNQPSETTLTTESTVEQLEMSVVSRISPVNDEDVENINVTTGDTGVTTNNVPDTTTTTSSPETSPALTNDNPNSLAGFQDTTTATAQRTAGDDAQATTEPSQTTISEKTPSPTPDPTTTMTEPSTTVPSMTTQPQTNSPETTTPETTSVSMETTLQTTSEPVTTTTTEAPMTTSEPTTVMTSASPATSTESPMTTSTMMTMMMNDTSMAMNDTTTTMATTTTTTAPLTEATTQYFSRFGNFRITPAPRFSVSSSTKTPLRDYLVYGIFPNKTIVRKRPEDNLIDARNVDSPYVIFGIFPDGKLVRKFPNGTVIPDPPTNPVEVVFSLSTTTSTTNRPRPVFIDNQQNNNNQAYYYNQNSALYNNRPSSIFANVGDQPGGFPSRFNLGLSDNSIGPIGDGPNFISNQSTGTKMSDSLMNTQTGTSSNAASEISGILTTTSRPVSGSAGPPAIVTPSNVNPQGGRIIQEKERDEASRSREAGGQRSTVYIGQEKFINYWSGGGGNTANNNSRLVSVKINSVASSLNEGPASSSVPQQQTSFDILPNSQSGSNQVTAPPGFPWKDPLDQIFGITTDSSVITASVASNTLGEDSNPSISPIMPTAINPLVEVFGRSSFTPDSGALDKFSASTEAPSTTTVTSTEVPTTTTTTTTPAPTTRTTTTPAPTTTTTTTTPAPTTTTTTTPAPTTTTTTTTPAPTTTTTTTTTTTPAPTTTTTPAPTTTTTTTTPAPTTTTTTVAPTTTTTTPIPTTVAIPAQTAFGTTFDDLAFLNSLLQKPIGGGSTPKTLTEVEQLLANKILSLALGKPGPTRSPKAIQSANASPNSIISYSTPGPSSQPIIIDLLGTTEKPKFQSNEQATWRPVVTTKRAESTTFTSTTISPTITTKRLEITTLPVQTTSKPFVITRAPVVITARPIVTSRPRVTTTPAPPGFAATILQALFGGNPFAPSTTTQRPIQLTRKPVQTTKKPIQTTLTPVINIQTESPVQNHVTSRQVETLNLQSNALNSLSLGTKTTPTTLAPKTSTYSSEDDAKFLAALLKNVGQSGTIKSSASGAGNSQTSGGDDEAFLRAILNGQASVKSAGGSSSGQSDAAFLAALLKAQGIEPSTPANRLREQLQSARSSTTTPSSRNIPLTTKKSSPARPKVLQTTWSPSSTYPPPLFSNFANFGSASQGPRAESNNEEGDGSVRSQVFNVAIGATRAFSQFLGAAITGAAQQLQSFVRNGTS